MGSAGGRRDAQDSLSLLSDNFSPCEGTSPTQGSASFIYKFRVNTFLKCKAVSTV